MILTIDYSYIQHVTPPRCRKPRPTRFDDGVAEVTICEVTSEQAPVAIISRKLSGLGAEPVRYRWFDGRLWTDTPILDCERRRQDSLYTLPGSTLSLITDSASLTHHALGISVCAWEGKQGIMEYLHAWAADNLLVDGQLYRPAGEPRFVVMTFGLSNNHGGTALLCTDYFNSNIRADAYFSLLEKSAADEYAQQVALERGDTKKFSTDPGYAFEVLIPEAVQWKRPADGGQAEA